MGPKTIAYTKSSFMHQITANKENGGPGALGGAPRLHNQNGFSRPHGDGSGNVHETTSIGNIFQVHQDKVSQSVVFEGGQQFDFIDIGPISKTEKFREAHILASR
jgi:hypothetical protein